METLTDFIFLGSKITADGDCSHEIKRHLLLGRIKEFVYDKLRQHIKKQRHYFANIGPSSQSYGFTSSCVWMWELDYKESWAPKNRCFWIWCWRRLLRVTWIKEVQPVHSEGDQSWIIVNWKDWCWSWNSNPLATYVKNWLIWKDPDAGKDWRQEEKGMTDDEMVG